MSSAFYSGFRKKYFCYLKSILLTKFLDPVKTSIGYTYCMEIVHPKYRGPIGIFIDLGATGVGSMLVSLNGWLMKSWVYNHVFFAVSVAMCIPFWFIIPESFRWYFSRGYVKNMILIFLYKNVYNILVIENLVIDKI